MTKRRKKNVLGVTSVLSDVVGGTVTGTFADKAGKFVKKSVFKKKGKKNPGGLPEAEDLSEKWHGRKPKTETEVTEIESYQEDLAELADLEELGVMGQDLSLWTIPFKTDRPKLCAEDENNLIFIGGDQSININDVGLECDDKRLVPLGFCYQICYEADKYHLEGSNGKMESYQHFFCEEEYKEVVPQEDFTTRNGDFDGDAWFLACLDEGIVEECAAQNKIPMLVYNKTDQKLLLIGGNYTVEDVGIKN